MHIVLKRFADQLDDSSDPDAFRKAMAEAATHFDVPCFAYLRMPRDNQSLAALVSSYPTRWTEHYLQQHFERLDSVIQQALLEEKPFEWGLDGCTFDLTEDQKAFFEAARPFGVRCGFTIPVHDSKGPIAAVTFASDLQRPAFLRSIELNRNVLSLMAITAHAHIRRKLWRERVVNGVQLSEREWNCLKLSSEGKSFWAIGQLLGFERPTIAWHLNKVRAKLDVGTLNQAIALFGAAQAQGSCHAPPPVNSLGE
jgi:LuxR family transcriptional activator of conjugal transfer of Ti plasmids